MSTPSFSLLVVEGSRKGSVFQVPVSGIKLGRSSRCDIEINDPMLSRDHCCFEVRNDRLWVMDLNSANQTLVNDIAVEERELADGDIVTVGSTLLKVQITGDAQAPSPLPSPPPIPSFPPLSDTPPVAVGGEDAGGEKTVIDLGFKRPEDDLPPESAKKSFLRPLIWAVGAILILVAGVMLISDMGKKGERKKVPVKAFKEDKTLMLSYELVQADSSSIFRYELTLSTAGKLAVRIDDVREPETKGVSSDRHVRKEKVLDPAILKDLVGEVESSGFFNLQPSYTGFAAQPNQLEERTLTIALGKRALTSRVANRTEPDTFRSLREKLETFSKNELGIWAIQFSTEKLTELAKESFEIARKKYAERNVQYRNLSDAMNAYQEAIFYLDTVNPKPDFYASILEGSRVTGEELEGRYKDQRFKADRAINLSDWATAKQELKILCEMFPDRNDKRHREASAKLLDVEGRLKKRK